MNTYLGCMEYGAEKYCKKEAAMFQDNINHLSAEALAENIDCVLG